MFISAELDKHKLHLPKDSWNKHHIPLTEKLRRKFCREAEVMVLYLSLFSSFRSMEEIGDSMEEEENSVQHPDCLITRYEKGESSNRTGSSILHGRRSSRKQRLGKRKRNQKNRKLFDNLEVTYKWLQYVVEEMKSQNEMSKTEMKEMNVKIDGLLKEKEKWTESEFKYSELDEVQQLLRTYSRSNEESTITEQRDFSIEFGESSEAGRAYQEPLGADTCHDPSPSAVEKYNEDIKDEPFSLQTNSTIDGNGTLNCLIVNGKLGHEVAPNEHHGECHACKSVEDLMGELAAKRTSIRTSDFESFDEEWNKRDENNIPPYLDYVHKGMNRDITACTTFSDHVIALPRALLYAVVHEMHSTQLQDINVDVILKWGSVIKDAKKLEFDVLFAEELLKKTAHAYFSMEERREFQQEAESSEGVPHSTEILP